MLNTSLCYLIQSTHNISCDFSCLFSFPKSEGEYKEKEERERKWEGEREISKDLYDNAINHCVCVANSHKRINTNKHQWTQLTNWLMLLILYEIQYCWKMAGIQYTHTKWRAFFFQLLNNIVAFLLVQWNFITQRRSIISE